MPTLLLLDQDWGVNFSTFKTLGVYFPTFKIWG